MSPLTPMSTACRRAAVTFFRSSGSTRARLLGLVLLSLAVACCGVLARRAGSSDTLAPTRYDAAIRRATRRHLPPGWDWRILKAMVYQESRFDARALSAVGAVGLCQLLPASAPALGIRADELYHPEANLEAGARTLRQCWDGLDGWEDAPPRWDRTRAAIAAYHAGPSVLRRAHVACGPAGHSWRALSGYLPAAVRQHVESVFGPAYRGVRRVHPGGAVGVGPAAASPARTWGQRLSNGRRPV